MKQIEFITEMAEAGKVYAASKAVAENGERLLLVFFPTTRGAYWLVKGKLLDELQYEEALDRFTWTQTPMRGVRWVPNPLATPMPQPDGVSVFHWLENEPMYWFVPKGNFGG